MRTRSVLHEAENEAKAKTYEAEATKFALDHTDLEHLTSLLSFTKIG